jgi:hypothetical protein
MCGGSEKGIGVDGVAMTGKRVDRLGLVEVVCVRYALVF